MSAVDWLTREIETARPTQFQWLQRTLADHFGDDMPAYSDAVNPGAGSTANKFMTRLNDAHCRDIETIRAALAALGQRHGLVGPAIIKALEVSLDFYPKCKPLTNGLRCSSSSVAIQARLCMKRRDHDRLQSS
jgi:hypothetical protein